MVLLDNRMPGLTGLEAAEAILRHHPDQVIILFSAYIDEDTEARAHAIGIKGCVSKIDAAHLPSIVRGLMTHRHPPW